MSERIKRWWFLWWDEIAIGTVTTLFICGVIYGAWYIVQTTPADLAEGVVAEPGHRYTAEYEETHDGGSTCYVYDEDGYCTVRIQNPDIHHTHCVGGCFELRIDGCSNNRRGDTICRKEWITVHGITYHNCRVGQAWTRDAAECALR